MVLESSTVAIGVLKQSASRPTNAVAKPMLPQWEPVDAQGSPASEFDSAFQPLVWESIPTRMPITAEALAEHDEMETAISALQIAAEQLHRRRDELLEQCYRETLHLGIAIAERLLRRTLEKSPEVVVSLVQIALSSATGGESARVHLHPADCELIQNQSNTVLSPSHRSLEFIADESLTRGDCLVETQGGQVDARLETILDRIATELT